MYGYFSIHLQKFLQCKNRDAVNYEATCRKKCVLLQPINQERDSQQDQK